MSVSLLPGWRPAPVITSHLGAGDCWRLVEPWEVCLSHCTIWLPEGFTSDLASVPKFLHWLVDEDSLGDAPWLHDALYKYHGALPIEWCHPYRRFSRKEADRLLMDLAKVYGCPTWRAELAALAVRIFAGPAWR